MDREDLPTEIKVPILTEDPLAFAKLPETFETKDVVYNAKRPLSWDELKEVLAIGSITPDDMKIKQIDPPSTDAETARKVAEFVSNMEHIHDINKFGAASWKITPTTQEYPGERELKLSLVVKL